MRRNEENLRNWSLPEPTYIDTVQRVVGPTFRLSEDDTTRFPVHATRLFEYLLFAAQSVRWTLNLSRFKPWVAYCRTDVSHISALCCGACIARHPSAAACEAEESSDFLCVARSLLSKKGVWQIANHLLSRKAPSAVRPSEAPLTLQPIP